MRACQDPLAVWTHEEAGEETAYGNPGVTDAERVAAGRETLADRQRALLEANRSRAAKRYAAGDLPDGQDMMRVWRPRDPAELYDRLGDGPLAAWAEDDILHVLWRGRADDVQLIGGVQPRLWPVADTDLWEASLRIRRLDEAAISIVVLPRRAGQTRPKVPDSLIWRGPRAPAQPQSGPELSGTLEEHTLDSATLRAPRQLTVYRPPEPVGAGCVLADGQSASGFAPHLEAAIVSGAVPPVLLVGVHNASTGAWPDRRAQEYIPGVSRRRFAAHMKFVADEVVPWAGPVKGPWVASGYSNGGVWAINAGQRRPDVFGAVAAFSSGMVPHRISGPARQVRHYLAAGTLEPGFRRATRDWADRLRRAGLPCRHEEWIGGHDQLWWEQQLPVALAWLLT